MCSAIFVSSAVTCECTYIRAYVPVNMVDDFGDNLSQVNEVIPRRLDVTADGGRPVIGPAVALDTDAPDGKQGCMEVVLLADVQKELAICFRRHTVVESLGDWGALNKKIRQQQGGTTWLHNCTYLLVKQVSMIISQ